MPRKKITAKEFVEQATGVRLSAHERICAERMKTLNDSINELKREVKSLRQDVSKGKGAVAVLVFVGTLVASIVGFFAILSMRPIAVLIGQKTADIIYGKQD